MKIASRPMKQSILTGCFLFIAGLCVLSGVVNWGRYSRIHYGYYQAHIGNVLHYTASLIDKDDLAECIRTGVESDKFHELQKDMDRIKDNVDLHFLYIVIPLKAAGPDSIQNIMEALSQYEYEYEYETSHAALNSLSGTSYSDSAAAQYLNAYESGELSYFENRTKWGDDFTGLLPLYDSAGNRFAALCMDIDIQEIHTELREQIGRSVLSTAVFGILFTVLFLHWSYRNISHPLELLEASVTAFAYSGRQKQDPDALVLKLPPIHTGNEVESLALAVEKMSEDIRDSVKHILNTKEKLAKMNQLARRDALTSVGNKTAWMQYCEQLEARIRLGIAEFAILVADSNRLKYVNDTFGHEKGDLYLKNCCTLLCDTFVHSPAFRIGGDEFIIILTGKDYRRRKALLNEVLTVLEQTENQEDLEPWERTSISLGMAAYHRERDNSVKSVFDRADQRMYKAKQLAHARHPRPSG